MLTRCLSRSVTRAHLHRSISALAGASTNSAARSSRVSSLTAIGDSPSRRCLPIPPPCLPLLHVRYTFPSSYGGSVTRLPFTSRSCGDPRFTTPESSCRSVSNHPVPSHVRFPHARFISRSGVVTSGPFPVCAHRFSQLRHSVAGSPRHKAESSF